jgi:hypothetical protein
MFQYNQLEHYKTAFELLISLGTIITVIWKSRLIKDFISDCWSHIVVHYVNPIRNSYIQQPEYTFAINRIYEEINIVLNGSGFNINEFLIANSKYDINVRHDPQLDYHRRLREGSLRIKRAIEILRDEVKIDRSIGTDRFNVFIDQTENNILPDIITAQYHNLHSLFLLVCKLPHLRKYPIEYNNAICIRDMFGCKLHEDFNTEPNKHWII